MKKLLSVIVMIILIAGLIGCSNSTEDKAIEQGKLKMEEQEYNKALAYFELAINEGTKDEDVKSLVEILEGFKESKKLIEEGEIEEAEKMLNGIDVDYENYVIKDDIDSLKEEVNNYENNSKFVDEKLEVIDDLISEDKYVDAKMKSDEILNDEESISKAQKERIDSQVKIIDSELTNIENKKEEEKEEKQTVIEQEEVKKEKIYDPYEWGPGIREEFEAAMRRDYLDISDDGRLIYEKGEVYNNEGRYSVYIMIDGEKAWLVGVNVKTGDYHG